MLWENIVEKGEIAQMNNFTFFHNVFYGICILTHSQTMTPFDAPGIKDF